MLVLNAVPISANFFYLSLIFTFTFADLPPTTELEEGLRNGVYLAKLGNFFAPKVVSVKRIYDREQTRYKSTQTNLIKTLTFSPSSPLPPQIFYPETTDIYDRKNMPRCIYCIHALSLYLFKLGLAPQITDLYGKVAFTEEEINNMKSELEKYNIQMPAFSKIGGILANELSVDEAALHAAVIAINEAIDHGDPQGTLAAMRNPNAMLLHLDESSAQNYQDTLFQAKAEKVANSRKRIGENADAERDVYEELLTQAEIQGNVNKVNVTSALSSMEQALLSGDEDRLFEALLSPALGLQSLKSKNKGWYLKQLLADHKYTKKQIGRVGRWQQHEVQSAIIFVFWSDRVLCVHGQGSLTHPELLVAVEMLSSVVLINEALDVGDRAAVWKQLSSSVTGLSNVEDEYAQRFYCFVYLGIAAIGLINEALDEGDPKKTLEALQHPAAKLTDVDPSISQHYFNKLLEARREKAHETRDPSAVLWLDEIQEAILRANKDTEEALQCKSALNSFSIQYQTERCVCWSAGDNGSEWMKHWVKGGHNYYYNLKTSEGTWDQPADFVQNNKQLNKDEIQSVVSGVTAAYNREQLWLANESLIAKLQARCRGFLVRRSLKERLRFLETQDPAIKCIQAHWRGYKEKKAFNERKQFLKDHTEDAVKIQSMVRMHQARKKYRDRLKYFKDHIDDVVKIQAFIRANKARDDYKTLINADDPPMAVVRKFVHLLDHSDQDFQEELELMRLREEVITNIRSNQQLENDLNLMDIKIGLLVKNKITLQEVVSHSKKLTKKNKGELSNLMMMNKQKGGLKALSKEKREKLEAYQYLFYLLQNAAARLVFNQPKRVHVTPLLIELHWLPVDARIKFKTLTIAYKLMTEQLLPTYMIVLIWDCTFVLYSKLPYDVTPEQAMSHEEVRNRLEASIKNMRTVTDKFLSAIVVSVDKIPYGMRFIAKVLKDTLHEKFPDATEDELLKIVGNLLYYRYMNPAIVAPDAFDIIDMSAGGQLTTDQRRNLGSIAKMLQHAASNKMFLGDNAHLNPINEYLTNSYQKFRRFFLAACDVPTLEEKFNVDQYSDLVTVSKPVIYISIGEIINTHTLLLDHQDAIAPEHNDPIHELLEDLGEVPTIESLIGENPLPPDDPNKEMMGKTEVSLTLTNKFDVPGEANAEMDAKTLLLNTKRLIVDVIRFQPGETLSEILETAATPEQEVEYQRAMQRRAIRDAKTPEKMKQTKPVVDDSLTLQGKKDKIKSNLQRLAELGKVHPENRYQDLINDIAKDIRNQRRYRQRRKAELVKLQQTNSALNTKTSFYNVQIDYYNQYIKTCMDNLASKGKVSKKPGDNKAKKSKQASQKYTAARLHEKGVLIEIEDLQTNQFKNVHFEISPSEVVGVFEIKAKFMGVHLETLMLEYQDLLQLQYEGVAVMKLFDRATVNVNLLIFLLNKKFYGK
uniref:IQ motif containing GTPase activating protein 1 n=1 Tax=Astyanax mexicanus TaxID=7994 RepID=A0A8B9HBH1_ASTMX